MKQFWDWANYSECWEAYLFVIFTGVALVVTFLALLLVTKGTITIPLVFVLFFLVYKKYKEETSKNKGEH